MTLTIKQVADITGLSLARLYQLDAVLRPALTPRGTKMISRVYDEEVVNAFLAARKADSKDVSEDLEVIDGFISESIAEMRSHGINECAGELEAHWRKVKAAVESRKSRTSSTVVLATP